MFDSFIYSASSLFGVPVAWIKAVIGTESSWNPRAYRSEPRINDASYGLMQLLSRTARGLGYTGDVEGLYDPETNIYFGTKLLGQLRDRYGDDFERVYSAYNSGDPDRWLTSSQVAENVSRAVQWLQKYILEAGGAESSAVAGVLLVVALLAWARKKR